MRRHCALLRPEVRLQGGRDVPVADRPALQQREAVVQRAGGVHGGGHLAPLWDVLCISQPIREAISS